MKKTIKLDALNKKILFTLNKNADLSNQELAERVGLSPSACFQRTKALREAGYFFNVHTELDLDRICHHVLAYVDVCLKDNTALGRRPFEKRIQDIPEFMDCMRVNGDVDYTCFTCFSDAQSLNACCDELTGDADIGISRIRIRTILSRAKWYLGYPLDRLEWIDD